MNHRANERGMATAEYAVGTLGTACIACIIFKLEPDMFDFLTDLIGRIRSISDYLIWRRPWI